MKFLKGWGSRKQAEEPVRRVRLMEGQNEYVFRRSRTLTGSASSKVSTIESRQRDLKSPRLKLHELHGHRRRLLIGLGALSVLTLGCLYAIGTSLALVNVRAEGNVVLTSDEEAELQGRIRSFSSAYPGQALTMLLDQPRLTAYLQQDRPDIDTAYLTHSPFLPANTVVVRFRTPLVAWNVGGQQFYIDSDGTMFKRLHGNAPTLTVEDASGVLPNDSRTSVASKRFIRYLGKLLGAIEHKAIGSVSRVVIPASTRELNVYFEGRDYPVKTHIDRHPEGQAADIASALQYLDKQGTKPQYVDVRVEGKAYYK
ncbi:hypothetical protein JNJ66_04830 [Candidatus Saccharibacteria bacterium]|nr:hypothetical protein [Candidatus Saccharibacteria bacterium]